MSSEKETSTFSHQDLNRTIHERARLGILTILATKGHPIAFNELTEQAGLTNGNLSRHLSSLEKEGIVHIEKSFEAKRPKTTIALTKSGRNAYFEYIDHLEALILEARKLTSERTKPA